MPIREAEGKLTHCEVMGFTVQYLTPSDCKMMHWRSNVQQNSINRTHMGLGRCWIIEYARLSDDTYTDV